MLAYVSVPYSDPDPVVKQQRLQAFAEFDVLLTERGVFAVSPMYKAFMLDRVTFPDNWEYWKEYSLEMLKHCEVMYVLLLPGWDASTGVQAEIAHARELGITIHYMPAIT